MKGTIAVTMLHPDSHITASHEEQFRLILDSIEDYAIYAMDPTGQVLTWNRGANRIKGYAFHEIVGRNFQCFYSPEDIAAGVPQSNLALAARLGRCSGEGWRLRKNGEPFWASFVITAMYGSDHAITGFSKVTRDLTEQKLQEDALRAVQESLRRERDRLHAAAESSMDAFWICEAVRTPDGDIVDFTFTYLNSNVEKMVSIPREKLLGGRMCELLPINRTQGIFEHYKQVVLTGRPYIAELAVQAENVLSAWIRVQAVRLEDGVAITASDITARKRTEERVLHLATHDPLTGLLNRSFLNDRIDQALEQVKRSGGLLALCVIDLDRFKPINDSLGHLAGDTVLAVTAQRIQSAIRATDTASRIGGDEFVVVFSRIASIADIERCARTILQTVETPIPLGETSATVTCSIGISVYSGPNQTPNKTIESLFHQADQAMYTAKRNANEGQPRYVIANN